jgi:hypothetical protein
VHRKLSGICGGLARLLQNIAQADVRLDGFGLRINRTEHRLELSDAWVLRRYTREELDGKPAMNRSRP